MVTYDSASIYIESFQTIAEKIIAIDLVIDGLMSAAFKAASNENITEYSLDDGQTKIRTVYRGVAAIELSINAFERIKQRYVNQLNGRVIRLVDSKNFIK